MHGVNGPEQLCEYLDLPVLTFKDSSESTEEQEIAEVSECDSEGSESELEDPASAYGREGLAGTSSCQDQGKGVASQRLSKPPETSRVETPLDGAGAPAHPNAQSEASDTLASDSVPTSGHVPRPSGHNPQTKGRQPRRSEAEPTSSLGSQVAETTAYHGSASAPASAEATAEANAEARGRRSEATAHLGSLAEAKGRKAEALPRRYPKLTFLDNRVPSPLTTRGWVLLPGNTENPMGPPLWSNQRWFTLGR